jgi:predicted aspartyl protease
MSLVRRLPALALWIGGVVGGQGLPAPALAQSLTLHFETGAGWAALSYESVRGEILFQATVNGRPATVLLDNGTDRTVIDTSFARRNGIELRDASARAVTGAGTSRATRIADNVTLAAPHAFSVAGSLTALDLQPMAEALGRRVDVILGADMLDHFAIMIQPAKRLLSLAPSGSITAGDEGIVVPLLDGNKVEAEIDDHKVRLKVDLGFNGVVRLTDAAWRQAFPNIEAGVAGSQTTADGAVRATRSARAALRLGRVLARAVPIDSGHVADGSYDGLLGTGFLARGTTVLDRKMGRLTLVAHQPAR